MRLMKLSLYKPMNPYSIDLRQKIIDVYEAGSISQRKLARQFHVALSFVQKLIKKYRETGNIAPKVRIQQTPTKLSERDLKVLSELVSEKNDATLEELREQLAFKTGVLISPTTVHRMLRRFNLTVKKKPYIPQKKELKKFKKNV